jgi:hypothetical protein
VRLSRILPDATTEGSVYVVSPASVAGLLVASAAATWQGDGP